MGYIETEKLAGLILMIESSTSVLENRNLQIGYAGTGNSSQKKIVADNINAQVNAGELICLLGPNGSGKSTLIKTMAGMLRAMKGEILLFGDPLSTMNAKAIARRLSTVLTDRVTVGNLSVYDLVSFGRSPYTGWLGTLKKEDEQQVRWAIEATGLRDFVKRDISKLSDGELQKVMIARALAQDTSVILLDEPTAHLDLPNRVEIIRLLRKLAHETGKGILLSTHELDLALKAGDRIWLMNLENELFSGVPEDMVLNGTFEEVFKKDSFEFDRETGSFKIHRLKDKKIGLTGENTPVFWTRRALEREGYRVVENGGEEELNIVVESGEKGYQWLIKKDDFIRQVQSVDYLIALLRDET